MNNGTPAKDAALAVDYDPFADGALSRVVPSTEPQREIWLADQLGAEASLAYNESVSLHLRGALDQAALHAALQSLVDRHDALRASFGPDGEALCVREQMRLELPLLDLSAADPVRREQALAERRAAAVETPFALGRDHLLRGELLRLAHDEHVLILTAHHIVCDGWSWWVLVRELGTLYAQRLGQAAEALPAAEAFADYALAQARQPDAASAQDEQYWLARFADEIPVLDLPTDRPRPARRGFASAREDWTLDAELVGAIRRLGARSGASLFATLLGSFAALLARLAHQPRVVIGIPTAGQAIDGHEALVGHCVNTLPLLFEPDLERPAALAIEQAQTTLLDALEHQRLTFGTLLRKLRIGRDPSRLPLVSVMLAAGDTFRAAAIEQLKVWGERVGAPVLARETGSDAAGLAYDALAEAREKKVDVLLVDTAGRLHNKADLMAELAKIVRVMKKLDPSAPHRVLLVLDATTGQNAISQVATFREICAVTGLVITKLDGTARGGVLVAIADKFGLPVHFVGVGEQAADLQPFAAEAFARALAGLEAA